MNKNLFDRISTKIGEYENDVVDLQTRLTALPALSPENNGQGEWEKSKLLTNLLQPLAVDEMIEIHAPDKRVPSGLRPNFIAMVKGHSSKKTVWIMSHLDIVPPGDLATWDHDPYRVFRSDDLLFGRGVEDNQQAIVSSILAVKAFREIGEKPEYDLGLVIVSDEETGSKYGIEHVLREKKSIFRPDDLIIIPDAGNEDGTMIEVAEKSICWIKCLTRGKQTHGSTPEKGNNAHRAAAHLIVLFDDLQREYNAQDPVFDPPISTFEPTKKEANVPNINTVPGEDVFYMDCRIMPCYSMAVVIARMRAMADRIEQQFGVSIELQFPQKLESPKPTSSDAPVALALKKAVRDVLGREAKSMGIGGGTVAAHFRHLGLPAVCWTSLDDTAHASNESCRIGNVLNDARVFIHVCLQK